MQKRRTVSIAIILTTIGFSTALADESATSDVNELFSQKNKVTADSSASTGKTTVESEAVRPSMKTSKTVSKKQDEPATKTQASTDQVSFKLEPKKISYTLPTTIQNAQVELSTLDGKVLYKSQDTGGSIDTTALNGYYIVRVTDAKGQKSFLTRAVAINQ